MRVTVVTFVECWQDEAGNWMAAGGFPLQMAGIGGLFDEMSLLVVRGQRRNGGTRLPERARVIPLRRPVGENTRRKLSVLMRLPYYLSKIVSHVSRADVVSIAVPGDIPFLGLLTALSLRKRLLVRYEGSWTTTTRTTWMSRLTKSCMRAFTNRSNVMLVTGAGESPPAPGLNWLFATALCRSELERIRPALERTLSKPAQLTYIGRLSPEKGVKYLLKALALLKEEGFSPMPLTTLVGDGPEREVLKAQVRELRCEDLIAFAGQLDRSELSQQLSRADLCVQPSLTEGYSKAWLDAMAHGLPVLSSNVGAASAVIGGRGERGWLVPPGDSQALADTLRRVLTAPVDWPDLRRRCRNYVEERTLEAWSLRIGETCARRWNMRLVEGKLHP